MPAPLLTPRAARRRVRRRAGESRQNRRGYTMSRIELTITRTAGVNGGGYRIAAIVGGAYVSRLFLGYTRREAVRLFRAAARAGGLA